MDFSVIVSIENEYNLISNFLETVLNTTNFAQGELVIVTDGCKNVDTMNYLKTAKDTNGFITLISAGEQRGYSISNNIAAKQSKGDVLVFINSDVLTQNGSIEKLVTYIKTNSQVGAAQGRLIYPQNNQIQSTGHLFFNYYNSHVYKGKPYDHPLVLKENSRQALTTAFCALTREMFFKFGGFDEKYYNAYEGMELTLKITDSGSVCMYYPDASAYHITGATRSNIKYDNELAGRLFWSRWHGKVSTDIHEYILPQMTPKIRNHIYLPVCCSSISDWDDVLEKLCIETAGRIDIQDRFETSVNLYRNLPFEALRYPGPYLFLCNDSISLSGNHNWCNTRNEAHDMVIDSHGNMDTLQEITGVCGK